MAWLLVVAGCTLAVRLQRETDEVGVLGCRGGGLGVGGRTGGSPASPVALVLVEFLVREGGMNIGVRSPGEGIVPHPDPDLEALL